MNIQQLNQNGQHIRVFVITACIALLLTFFVWFCIAQITAYAQWREQYKAFDESKPWPKKGKNYHLLVRVCILYMLLRGGCGRWAWITGAWIRILTNERAGVHRDFKNLDQEPVEEFCDEETTACDYVCSYVHGRFVREWFNPEDFKRR